MARKVDGDIINDANNLLPGISKIPLFKGFSKETLNALLLFSSKRRVGRGEFIFRQGEEATSLIYIVSGSAAELLGNGSVECLVKHHSEDATICESNLLAGGSRVSSLLAMEECELVEFYRPGLLELEFINVKEFLSLHSRLGRGFSATAEGMNRKLNHANESPFVREQDPIWRGNRFSRFE